MKFSMRFWRPKEQSASSWLGNCWISIPGMFTELKGSVFTSTINEGIYINFGNARKGADGKYGNPCIILADELQDVCNVAINEFWYSPVNKVDLEVVDGVIGIDKKEKIIRTIKGADDLIKAALKVRRTTTAQDSTYPTQHEEESDEEKAM